MINFLITNKRGRPPHRLPRASASGSGRAIGSRQPSSARQPKRSEGWAPTMPQSLAGNRVNFETMLYAIQNNIKVEPSPNQKGKCPSCGEDVFSKCGEVNIWYWSHFSNKDCDDWWEPETEWHRHWKQKFGSERSEIVIKKNDVLHIADTQNKKGVVIELQNSPISTTTIRQREEFYGEKMLWIVNVEPFKENFSLNTRELYSEKSLPANVYFHETLLSVPGWFVDRRGINPNEALIERLELIYGFAYKKEIGMYFRSLTIKTSWPSDFKKLIREINNPNKRLKPGHLYFNWNWPWKSWSEARRHVFIDLGDALFHVNEGMGTKQGNGKIVSMQEFLSR